MKEYKLEKDTQGRKETKKMQHEKSVTSTSATWKGTNRETMWKKGHPKKVQHKNININEVRKEKCKLLKMQHGKSAT